MSREWPLQYRTSYTDSRGRPADMLHDFYIPALSLSSRYDRMAGYFRSSSLAAASMGFSSFVNRRGRMRMIVGADLDEADVEAIIRGDNERLQRRLNEQLESPHKWPEDVQNGVGLLGWMVGQGFLEVRVAFRIHRSTGKPIPFESCVDGYVHEKWLVMGDEAGNRLFANGSLNESRTALQFNAESLDIHCDWWDRRSRQRVDDAEIDFQRMWEGKHPHILVMSLPEAVWARLIFIGDSYYRAVEVDGTSAVVVQPPSAEELFRFALVRDGPRLPKGRLVGVYTAPVEPWPHQAIVASRLVETWPHSYLLCDEVGLGKTIEAALAFRGLYLSGIARRILVAVPAGLTAQWQRQMWSKTFLSFGKVMSGADAVHEWIVPGEQETKKVKAAGIYEPDLTIISADLMARDQRLAMLQQATPFDIALLDEAHNARRSNPIDGAAVEPEPNKLYSAVHDVLRKMTKSLWMATATPMQLHPIEVHDLIALTDRVGAFQYDPTLTEQYYDILARVQGNARVSQTDLTFVRKAVKAIKWEDPPYWKALHESLSSRRNRDRMKRWLDEGRIRSGDSDLLSRLLFGAAPLSRVMMRHTRPLLEIYRREGRLTQNLAKREIKELPAIKMDEREERVYSMLEEYCRGLASQIAKHSNRSRQYSMGFVLSFFRLRFASSLFALRETARRRLDKVEITLRYEDVDTTTKDYETGALEEYDDERDDVAVTEYLKDRSVKDLEWERNKLMQLINAIGNLDEPSSKMIHLLNDLDDRVDLVSGRIQQTVIFTRFYDTLTDISAWLRRRKPGILLGCYSGKGCEYYDAEFAQMVSVDREEIKERFLRGEIDILICTDAAAEGVNLQTADLLINFDMGWNPMRLEQRIGRIDRIGQKHPKVYVLNLFYLGSAEEIVYGRLLRRLASAGLVVGPQQMSLLPVEENEFEALADGILTEQELYERCLKRIKAEKTQRSRLEMPPEELYELYNRMGEAAKDEIPVKLEEIWRTIQSSQYLRQLGCTIEEETNRGTYFVLGHVPGIPRGTRLTASRKLYEEGLADGGSRLHFATYGDQVFDMLVEHMGQFELPDCIRRISVIPVGMNYVQVIGYVVNCQNAAGVISPRLITSWDQLQDLTLNLATTVTDQAVQDCKRQLQQIANETFALCRSAESIAAANRNAAVANLVLNHVVIETYLHERWSSHGHTQFWHVDAELEQRLKSIERMHLSGVPRSRLKNIRPCLLFDPGPLDAPDLTSMSVPAVHLRSARDAARRAANASKRPRNEITLDSVLASLRRKGRMNR
jgi:superfamily II DNA or RNA helicase